MTRCVSEVFAVASVVADVRGTRGVEGQRCVLAYVAPGIDRSKMYLSATAAVERLPRRAAGGTTRVVTAFEGVGTHEITDAEGAYCARVGGSRAGSAQNSTRCRV